jgi:tRNA threonylcarbamoyladenosine biosynthesis protein TsaB
MRSLAIDASTWWGSVALAESDGREVRPVAELGLQVRRSHASSMLSAVEAVLGLAGWERSSVDVYVALRGPGSFTGVRIGLGTVRGLALAAGRPSAGVSTLEALAEAHGPAEAARLPVVPAGRGELFAALYDAAGSPPHRSGGPWVGSPGRLVEWAGETAAGVVIPAPGVEPPMLELLADAGWRASAPQRSLATAGARLVLLGGTSPAEWAESMSPVYVRAPDAEL